MCITYSVLSCKLATSFSAFLIFILPGKNGNHYEVHVMFQDIENQFQDNIIDHFLHYSFL